MRGYDFDYFEEELIKKINHAPIKSIPQLINTIDVNEIRRNATKRAIDSLVNELSACKIPLSEIIQEL